MGCTHSKTSSKSSSRAPRPVHLATHHPQSHSSALSLSQARPRTPRPSQHLAFASQNAYRSAASRPSSLATETRDHAQRIRELEKVNRDIQESEIVDHPNSTFGHTYQASHSSQHSINNRLYAAGVSSQVANDPQRLARVAHTDVSPAVAAARAARGSILKKR